MLKIIRVNRDGSATINTRGLRRIVDETGHVINEFVPASDAAKNVAFYNSMFKHGESRAKAVTYKQAAAMDAAG